MIPEVKTIYNDHGVHITHDAWGNTYDISSPKHNITLWDDRITTYILDTNPLNKSPTGENRLVSMARSSFTCSSRSISPSSSRNTSPAADRFQANLSGPQRRP